MKIFKSIFLSLIFLIIVSGCQTIKQKTDAIIKKENDKLSQYIGKILINLK